MRVGLALPLVAGFVGEHVVPGVPQAGAVRHARPAVGAELQPEQDDALPVHAPVRQVAPSEKRAVDRPEGNLLGVGHRVAAGDDEQRLLFENADHLVDQLDPVVNVNPHREQDEESRQGEWDEQKPTPSGHGVSLLGHRNGVIHYPSAVAGGEIEKIRKYSSAAITRGSLPA